MKQPGMPHVLLLSRPAVGGYPPVLHQAGILGEQGFRVSVADASGGQSLPPALREQVKGYCLGSGGESGPVSRLWLAARLWKRVRRLASQLQPDLVIAYDVEGCFLLGDMPRQTESRLVWHFHEMPERQSRSWTVRLATRYVYRQARSPDLIIFPDAERARIFADTAGIGRNSMRVVANCPRPLRQVPSFKFTEVLPGRLPPSARIVVYNGAVGPDHGLETAIRSMPQWPMDTHFVVKGRARSEYEARLRSLALHCGVAERVVRVEYSPGFEFYAGATIGWTVLEPATLNWKYAVGASNKRFECMAVGVPQITDNNPGVPELVEDAGCGACIRPDSVEAAVQAVNRLLNDPALRHQMGEGGRQLHLTRYNYDAQFKPVLEWIGAQCKPR